MILKSCKWKACSTEESVCQSVSISNASSPKQEQYGYLHIFLLQMLGLLFQTSSNGCQLGIAFLQCFDFLFQRFLIILLSFLKKKRTSIMMTSLFLWQNICWNSQEVLIILSTHYKLTPFSGTLKWQYCINVKDFDCVWCDSIGIHIFRDYCWCRDCRLNIARRAKVINGSPIRNATINVHQYKTLHDRPTKSFFFHLQNL